MRIIGLINTIFYGHYKSYDLSPSQGESMKLYGSLTSPFVRRLRLLLGNKSYEFIKLNITDSKDRAQLKEISPILKIPVMEIDKTNVWDSRQIFYALVAKGFHRNLTTLEENQLTAIDGVNDSLVQIFLIERSSIQLGPDNSYFKNNNERIELTVDYLEDQVKNGLFDEWNYPSMALYSLVDWCEFRSRYNFKAHKNIWDWYQNNSSKAFAKETDPRLN